MIEIEKMGKGLIIGGEFGNILVRQKNGESLELGELLVANSGGKKMLLQVFDLLYGSQLSSQQLELVSGMKLEEDDSLELLDSNLRTYILARLKNLALLSGDSLASAKTLPNFFTKIREIEKEDVTFLTAPAFPLPLGFLRSGSKVLDVPVIIDGRLALSHHILIAGTTGRGKSVLMTNMLWDVLDKDFAGMLVLDPHNEYFDRLRHHLKREKISYYTPKNPPPGGFSLRLCLSDVLPRHFEGVIDWTDAQRQALFAYYNKYHEKWISAIMTGLPVENFMEGTIAVVKRVLMQVLRLEVDASNEVRGRGVFDLSAGKTTISDIARLLDEGGMVIIDTSSFHGNVEILIGSLIASEVLERHKRYELSDMRTRPVVSIVLEEAPRVLGKEVLEKGQNVFSTIAREGRKFNVGLVAITQLPSLIPREILANINTKIILGIELRPERQAIIDSAAQDLSSDERMIASLDKGEALVTSNFLKIATPIKVPLHDFKANENTKMNFGGGFLR